MEPVSGKTVRWISSTGVLLALTLVIQMLALPQFFTGPLVNAFLLLAAVTAGVTSGVVIGLLTPWIAFMRGILPAPLGPLIPFIMIGNAALVIVFSLIRRRRGSLFLSGIAVAVAAVAKYLILSNAVIWVVEVPPPVAQVMQIPQLITALVGGAIAIALETVLLRSGYLQESRR